MPKLTDNSIMPWGKHKGKKLANIPNDYLLWLRDEIQKTVPIRRSLDNKELLEYIEDNMDVINKETKKYDKR